ncbi:DUF4349 domain-containing protein [Yinghuangia soli]|uniref:DUF4349 domain-containing protein n=1 Tax=Yinghuangia soli TaxID=2908204 RepID=A0AA41U1L9_9ACTN|nr:DUF4349 domain-containing protein [Yinghuangia soli]MCF2526259.1 DUF4349 domain-containing protein [Yinghuangia soli]
MLRRRTAAATAAASLVLLLGACSSGDDKNSSDSGARAGAGATYGAAGPEKPNAVPQGTGAAAPKATGAPAPEASAGSTGAPGNKQADPAVVPRRMILAAGVELEADDPEVASGHARATAIGMGGMVSGEQTTRTPRTITHPADPAKGTPARTETFSVISSQVTLKVPPAQFDAALDRLSTLGTVLSRTRTATDITEQVIDVESRIETQRKSVARVRDLLAKATSLTEIVSIEAELTRREADLESLMKRQQTLIAQSDLATIVLTVKSRPVADPPPAPPAEAKKEKKDEDGFVESVYGALKGGWHAFYETVRIILIVLAAVLPFAVLGVVLWLVLGRFGKRPTVALGRRWTELRQSREEEVTPWASRPRGPASESDPAPGPDPAEPDPDPYSAPAYEADEDDGSGPGPRFP